MARALFRRFWLGLLTIPALVAVAVVVTGIWGPVFGIWDWMEFSALTLILAVMGLALAEEFVRPPNPYGRTYHLYDLRDVSSQRDLRSASTTLLWQALPPAVAAAALFAISRLI